MSLENMRHPSLTFQEPGRTFVNNQHSLVLKKSKRVQCGLNAPEIEIQMVQQSANQHLLLEESSLVSNDFLKDSYNKTNSYAMYIKTV